MGIEARYLNGTMVYFRNGREMTPEEVEQRFGHRRPNYSKGECPGIKPPPDSGWEYENGGRGREITQLAEYPGDPNSFCRSRDEIREKAKKAGFTKIENA